MKLCKKIAALATSCMMAVTCLAANTPAIIENLTVLAVDDNNDDWLHAEGSRLYDKDGNEVWLTGANWFGLNCGEAIPHYLWSGDCDDMLSEVADRGINVIRFPISTELLMSWMNGTPNPVGSVQASYDPPYDKDDGNGGIIKAGTYGNINKDFLEADGKTLKNSEEIFDIILGKCKKYGIKAFIDIHSPHTDNSGHNYNLWYGKETTDGTMVTTDLWIKSLVWVAEKYKNDDTLIGYDLKNEPHGKGQEGVKAAKWDGSTDENNWAYAATKCADAILDVNPNALIFIEGVEQSMSGAMAGDYWGMPDRRDNSPYIGAWWGGNFRGAREYPIKPEHGTSQIVYSPHDYGPSVYAQTWFEKDFTTQTLLDDYWYDTWAYINAENIAPMLIGEWGGHMDGDKNQKWMELLRDYMIKNHISHTFWCLNTNSGDTGGLWAGFQYSINTGTKIEWDEEKYGLFESSLWQTQETGKYIGLDHKKALGNNGTGISLSEFYSSYSSTEGSNLDGGTIIEGKDPKPTTTSTTTKPITTTTTTTKPQKIVYGDVDNDKKVTLSDLNIVIKYVMGEKTNTVSISAGDVNGDGNVNIFDVSIYKAFIGGKLSKFPVDKS